VKLGARGAATHTHVAGRDLTVQVQDERRRKQRAAEAAASASGGGRRSVRSPMPGKVVKVLVEVGQTVHAGQGVVIVEAMKMENELKALGPGTVVEVKCREGVLVEGNAELLVIEG
jgi:biotin carboxyl carrier protein